MGLNQVDRQRRTDEVFYFLEDRATASNVIYYGRTPGFAALATDLVWQIKQLAYVSGQLITLYANDGKYNCRWDQRTSYFPAVPPGPPIPIPVSYPSGLQNGGRITEVTLAAGAWTALPLVPLSRRNAMCIQNISAVEIKLNYAQPGTYTGVVLPSGAERFYDITDQIPLYAKPSAGNPIIVVEEIS